MSVQKTTKSIRKNQKAKPEWIWQGFLLVYIFIATSNASLFFKPLGPLQTYYKILIGFQNFAIWAFLLNALAVIFDLLTILPFWGFVEGKRLLSKMTWQCFFILRMVFLFTGHAYEYKTIQSLQYHDPWVMISIINLAVIFYAPSYLATFLYAFYPKHKTE